MVWRSWGIITRSKSSSSVGLRSSGAVVIGDAVDVIFAIVAWGRRTLRLGGARRRCLLEWALDFRRLRCCRATLLVAYQGDGDEAAAEFDQLFGAFCEKSEEDITRITDTVQPRGGCRDRPPTNSLGALFEDRFRRGAPRAR